MGNGVAGKLLRFVKMLNSLNCINNARMRIVTCLFLLGTYLLSLLEDKRDYKPPRWNKVMQRNCGAFIRGRC